MATNHEGPPMAGQRVALAGLISGAAELAALATQVETARGEVTVDVGGIRAFTSSGIQAWLAVMHAVRARDLRLVFERCSPAVVRQTLSIHGFLADAAVRSVVAPYLCPVCDRDDSLELEVGGVASPAETRPCTCGAQMELDDLPEPYAALLTPPARAG